MSEWKPIKITSTVTDTTAYVDIEGLIHHVMEKADRQYHDDFPIEKIEEWIREFFEHA